MNDNVLFLTEDRMKKSIEKLKELFGTVRTGRASASLLENVIVDYYGAPTPVKQMSSVIISDAKTIEIKPFDPKQLNAVEKAVLGANIGITPQNDGKVIRLKVPSLNEDRRKELVKMVKKMAEDEKVVLRQERRDGVETVKKLEKEKRMTEDERFKTENDLQKLTDSYCKKIDEVLALKEKEIMTV